MPPAPVAAKARSSKLHPLRAFRVWVGLLGNFVLLGSGVGAASANPPTTAPPPGDLETLMRTFAAGGIVRARIRETRHLSMLAAPIESEGVIYFAPPDRLARFTTAPSPSSAVVSDGRVALRDDEGLRVFVLAQRDQDG